MDKKVEDAWRRDHPDLSVFQQVIWSHGHETLQREALVRVALLNTCCFVKLHKDTHCSLGPFWGYL